MTPQIVRLIALALCAVAVLSGCGFARSDDSGAAAGSAANSATDADPNASASTAASDSTDSPSFGDAFTWQNGLTISVSEPQPFEPSKRAAFDKKAQAHVFFDVTIVNNTGEKWDAGLTYISLQSGNSEAQQVFDSDNGLEGRPITRVPEGRETTFKIGFNVKSTRNLAMKVSPGDAESESTVWTS
ncbi:MAG: hypothetical protein ACRCYU_12525 [Nocardioides sp.]